MDNMYEFSTGWFFMGLLILAIGIAFVRYYQWVADNFGGGAGSYERYKLFAFITCALGFIVMINLHTLILTSLVQALFPQL